LERSGLGESHGWPLEPIFMTSDKSILRPKHRAYYRSGRPVIKIGPKGALDSHEIRPIHTAPSLAQSIPSSEGRAPTDLTVCKNLESYSCDFILITLRRLIYVCVV